MLSDVFLEMYPKMDVYPSRFLDGQDCSLTMTKRFQGCVTDHFRVHNQDLGWWTCYLWQMGHLVVKLWLKEAMSEFTGRQSHCLMYSQDHSVGVCHLGLGQPTQNGPPKSWSSSGCHNLLHVYQSSHKKTFVC